MAEQQPLFEELPEAPKRESAHETSAGAPKLKVVDRHQFTMVQLDVDTLVAADHRVRAIWELTGNLELSKFYQQIKSMVGQAGREHTDPRLLVAVWLYAYSEGMSSARAVSRQMEHEPGFRWLTGLDVINHTTLSEFRTGHREALDELFTGLLAVLEAAGQVDLEQVMHDGTKIQAQASGNSFRREKTVQESLARARQVVEELGDPEDEAKQSRREAARRCKARQKVRELETALEELEQIRESKSGAAKKAEARVSVTDPEARLMKHGNHGGITPSYNVQITTDAKEKVVVGVGICQNSSDGVVKVSEVVKEVGQRMGHKPGQVVVDGGYLSHDNIVEAAQQQTDLIGPASNTEERQAAARKASGIEAAFAAEHFTVIENGQGMRCPAGQVLERSRLNRKRGNLYEVYQGRGEVCGQCEFRRQCCPKGYEKGRSVSLLREEAAEVAAFREKMKTEAARKVYRRRSEVAETPNAWIKEKFGLRRFRLRGKSKVFTEVLWVCLTYNVMQWIRLVWRSRAAAPCLSV